MNERPVLLNRDFASHVREGASHTVVLQQRVGQGLRQLSFFKQHGRNLLGHGKTANSADEATRSIGAW